LGPHASASFPTSFASVALMGEIDIATAWRLRQAVLDQHAEVVALDLSEVTFIDAAGLRSLLEASDRLAAAGRRLLLVDASECVRRLLATVGLLDELRISPLAGDGAAAAPPTERSVVDLRDVEAPLGHLAAGPPGRR
jgi:anti-anti-sigma factor